MLLRLLNWIPADELAVPVVRRRPAGPHDPARPLTVLSWNVQFCGTRRHHYFYDGGPDTAPSPANARDGLAGVRRVLAELRAEGLDLALLQEVDRDSARTGRVDQLAELAKDWETWVSTPYYKSVFVPSPAPRPLGRMNLHEAILGRLELGPARRLALPGLEEPPLRRAFNLHRAILATTVPLTDGRRLHVAVTHLSAFSRGDGTMARQVDVLRRWIDGCGDDPFVLGGDLNLLAPGDDAARLGKDAREYVEDVLGRLTEVAKRVPTLGEHTYLPPGSNAPDRTLDHLFFSRGVTIESHRVVTVPPWLSDHWPLLARVRITP